jgi:16S rRNA processing protein RimM
MPVGAAATKGGGAGTPSDLVLMAYVKEPYGLTGRVRLHVYSDDLLGLAEFEEWWVAGPAGKPGWSRVVAEELVERGGSVIAKLPGVDDRDQAFARKGWQIAVSRAAFPPKEDGEYYWAELIGLAVKNREGVVLGEVKDLLDLGPHQVLRVAAAGRETLIPFIAQYVDRVDPAGGEIEVDWGPDY